MMPTAASLALPARQHGKMRLVIERNPGGFRFKSRQVSDDADLRAAGPARGIEKFGVHRFGNSWTRETFVQPDQKFTVLSHHAMPVFSLI